jgi:hypothetical protein
MVATAVSQHVEMTRSTPAKKPARVGAFCHILSEYVQSVAEFVRIPRTEQWAEFLRIPLRGFLVPAVRTAEAGQR